MSVSPSSTYATGSKSKSKMMVVINKATEDDTSSAKCNKHYQYSDKAKYIKVFINDALTEAAVLGLRSKALVARELQGWFL